MGRRLSHHKYKGIERKIVEDKAVVDEGEGDGDEALLAHPQLTSGVWVSHLLVEMLLEREGVKFEVGRGTSMDNVPYMKYLEQNSPRPTGDKLKKSLVKDYAAKLAAGLPFHRPVFNRAGAYERMPLSGFHRVAANEMAGFPTIDHYTVDVQDEAKVQLLIHLFNTLEGDRPSADDIMLSVVQMMEQYPGMTAKELAAKFQISERTAKSVQVELRAKQRVQSIDTEGLYSRMLAARIPASMWATLDAIHMNEPFEAMCKVAVDFGITVEDARRHSAVINAEYTTERQMKQVAEIRRGLKALVDSEPVPQVNPPPKASGKVTPKVRLTRRSASDLSLPQRRRLSLFKVMDAYVAFTKLNPNLTTGKLVLTDEKVYVEFVRRWRVITAAMRPLLQKEILKKLSKKTKKG